jgi:hypothetical protein
MDILNGLKKRLMNMGDGTVAEIVATTSIGLAASGVTPEGGTVTSGGSTAWITLIPGREAYLTLSNTGTASGLIEYRADSAAAAGQLVIEGIALGAFSYAGVNMVTTISPIEIVGAQCRINFTSVTGSVDWRITR